MQESTRPLKKILDKDTSLLERIHILFREHGVTISSIRAALSMTIATTVIAIKGAFGGGSGEAGGSTPKDKKGLLDRLTDALKRLAGKAAEALPPIIGSVAGGALSFLG